MLQRRPGARRSPAPEGRSSPRSPFAVATRSTARSTGTVSRSGCCQRRCGSALAPSTTTTPRRRRRRRTIRSSTRAVTCWRTLLRSTPPPSLRRHRAGTFSRMAARAAFAIGAAAAAVRRGRRHRRALGKPFIGVLDPATAGRRDQYVAPRRRDATRPNAAQGGRARGGHTVRGEGRHVGRGAPLPDGKLDRALGAVGDLAAESEAILVESAVDKDAKFSDEALAALPGAAWRVDEAEAARRLDLREGAVGEAVCSVDPPGCVDIDDALHAVEVAAAADGTRRFEVGVHIADVGHFITAGAPSTPSRQSGARPSTSSTSASTWCQKCSPRTSRRSTQTRTASPSRCCGRSTSTQTCSSRPSARR